MKPIVSVHLINGKTFRYQADNAEQAREHAAAITEKGYRHTFSNNNVMEFYPPSSILVVRVSNLKKYPTPSSRYQ